MIFGKKYALLVLVSLLSVYLQAQSSTGKFHYQSDEELLKKPVYFKSKSPLASNIYLQSMRLEWIGKGFLLANIDSVRIVKDSLHAYVYIGPKFPKINLDCATSNDFLESIGIFNTSKKGAIKPIEAKELSALMQNILFKLNAMGYPFAKVSLLNSEINGTQISAALDIDLGRHMVWKSIEVKGDSTFSSNSIAHITGVHIGDDFDENLWRFVDSKLQQMSYLQIIKPSEILFTPEGAELFVFLKSAKISSFNGAIGLQPNPVSQKLALTGELQLKLINALHQSEQFDFHWKSIQTATQYLAIKLNYPYLFKSNFGTDLKFNLYKRDSTFLELKSALGIQYQLKSGLFIKGIYQFSETDRLAGAGGNSFFNQSVSCKTQSYGLSISQRKIDYIPNPSKGFYLYVDAFAGRRTSNNNGVAESSTVFKGAITFEKYLPLLKRNILKLALNYESYQAPVIYQNERYRFGGLTSLRGFNEEALFATSKAIFSIEYRFLLDKNSNVFVFYDQGYYEDRSASYSKDHPFGFGLGTSIGSKFGIFSISYGLGRQFQNSFDLKQGKVHFGYTAYF